ncbi:cobyrinic acid a,c-diamide synthase [Marinomonas balearica]|uniref:Cobyrinic acid a,c-diamide synthase n=2 Tax=Marinomonas balearica TaxID=491947 RepID=A0A4R6MGW4_9GAMM|nr:cobyrinic acid a,c-diamide synthase [Marinomonas balearica]
MPSNKMILQSPNTNQVACPALFLTAPASNQGKTTITAALARHFSKLGKTVRVFKTGPDYLDPLILAQASGHPVEQLDIWMAGTEYCQERLYLAAQHADLILVEGAMGMFDGEPSSADLAACFGIPMAIVMDVKGMAQTAAAVASGLAAFRDDVEVSGLIANRCGSERHAQLIRDALPESVPLLATLKRDEEVTLPERHLGLVQAEEVTQELEQKFEAAVDWLRQTNDKGLLELPKPVVFSEPVTSYENSDIEPQLDGKRIAVAKDLAFSFIYHANLDALERLGAKIYFFSPLYDHELPDCDAVWLPGGYPELHSNVLANNDEIKQALYAFYEAGKPILAECGGMLYCLESLTDLEQNTVPMLGILQGQGSMRGKRGCQGMQTAVCPQGEIRAHAHHRSRSAGTPDPIGHGRRQRHPAPGEPIYQVKGLTASYLHFFFPSNLTAIAAIFSER